MNENQRVTQLRFTVLSDVGCYFVAFETFLEPQLADECISLVDDWYLKAPHCENFRRWNNGVVDDIVFDGCEKAKQLGKNTMRDMREYREIGQK